MSHLSGTTTMTEIRTWQTVLDKMCAAGVAEERTLGKRDIQLRFGFRGRSVFLGNHGQVQGPRYHRLKHPHQCLQLPVQIIAWFRQNSTHIERLPDRGVVGRPTLVRI